MEQHPRSNTDLLPSSPQNHDDQQPNQQESDDVHNPVNTHLYQMPRSQEYVADGYEEPVFYLVPQQLTVHHPENSEYINHYVNNEVSPAYDEDTNQPFSQHISGIPDFENSSL